MERRDFLRKAGSTLLIVTGLAAAVSYLRQFFPRVSGEKRRVSLDDPAIYPVDTYTFIADHNFFIYRDHEGIKAVSAVCTHLGCILAKTTQGFECPCHGSCFNEQGEVLSGPAPRDLAWYQVSGAPDGKITVDPGRIVGPSDKYITA
jgi:cytochrome b6-f complex iron-sulfur subunit